MSQAAPGPRRWRSNVAACTLSGLVACSGAAPAASPSARSGSAGSARATEAPSTDGPSSASTARAAQAQIKHSTAIVFRRFGEREFPYPLVRATVAGIDTFLLVDTGATHHVLARWLVRRAKLATKPSAIAAEGHVGEKLAPSDVQRPPISIDGWGPLGAEVVLSLVLPAVFEKLGLGGVLSPQALATEGYAVMLDFPSKRLARVAASHRLAAARGELLARGAAPVCLTHGRRPSMMLLVAATIEGRAARLAVDSGAARTDLSRSAKAARPLRSRATPGRASYTAGGRHQALQVSGARLTVGDVEQRIDLDLVAARPHGTCARDGNLGMDVLRRCVLLMSPARFDARCAPPLQPPAMQAR